MAQTLTKTTTDIRQALYQIHLYAFEVTLFRQRVVTRYLALQLLLLLVLLFLLLLMLLMLLMLFLVLLLLLLTFPCNSSCNRQ